MKYKIGDMVIIKKYYDDEKNNFIPMNELKAFEEEVYIIIKNKIPVEIIDVVNGDNIQFPYEIRIDKNSTRYLCNEEIEFAKITNWRDRLI